MNNDIFKTRSCSGCISSATNMYSNNFNKIIKGTWSWVVILSLLAGLFTLVSAISINGIHPVYTELFKYIGLGILSLSIFFISARVLSCVMTMINGHGLASSMKKTLRLNAFLIIMLLLVGIAMVTIVSFVMHLKFMQSQPFTTAAIMTAAVCIILMIAIAIFISPMVYSATQYAFVEDVKFRGIFGKSYGLGFRYLGFLFTLVCTVGLLFIVVCVFLCMPGCITFFANEMNGLGVLEGDASGLPSYFIWLNALSSAIMSFILQYLAIWVLLTYLYAYGSIENIKSKK